MRKLQALRTVHRHQLHRVARNIVFQAHRAARLVEIIQILQKFRQPLRIALRLPFHDKFRQPRYIFAILHRRAVANFQPIHHRAQNLLGTPAINRLSLR